MMRPASFTRNKWEHILHMIAFFYNRSKQFWKRLLILFLSLILLTFLFHSKNKTPETHKDNAPEVVTLVIKREIFPHMIRLPGTFISYESVNIYPKTQGYIYKMLADRGSIVSKNDVLAQLYDPELDAQIGAAEAKYLAAQERYNIAKPVTPEVVSPERLAALRGSYQSTYKEWQSLLARRSFLTITAPFDGIITTRYLHTGALVNKGSKSGAVPIFKIDRLDRLRLIAFVPQASVGNIEVGKRVLFSINTYPGKYFKALLARPAYGLNLETLTEPVELDVYNKDFKKPRFMPGMLANVEWPATRKEKTIVVPKDAIVTTTYDMFVIRVKNNLTEWVSIKRGYTKDNKVEIFGDLHDGDQIVRYATDQLQDNTPVIVARSD